MKIAFATQDKERVDAHFGWAKGIVVYEVTPQGHHFVERFDFGDKLEEDARPWPRRAGHPILGDPDPDPDPDPETLWWYLELFYNAIAVAIERETGQMVSPMMKMSHEGFGRMVLIAGRLVVVNKQLRDVHRFGFPSLAKLADASGRFLDEGISMIRSYPAVAQYGA